MVKPTSLLIQNVEISLNGLITMMKGFHNVSGFWNPFLFCFGTYLVLVVFMVNMLNKFNVPVYVYTEQNLESFI